jgi:hypothetical protein
MRQIEIEWVGIGRKVTVELEETKNGHLCDLLWRNLPYNSLQNHALVSGHHLYHLAPIVDLIYTPARTLEDRTLSPDGTVFLSHLQHLAVKYGELTEYLPAAAVGRVSAEHMSTLRIAGREIWDAVCQSKKVIEVRVTKRGEPADEFELPRPPATTPGPVQDLVEEIHAETQRIWITPPREILDLHEGRIASRAGSYEQYFSTLVFVNGETRPLAYCALAGLVKSCRTSEISLEALKQITANFIKTPAEFLGYCGLRTLWGFVERSLALLPELRHREDFFALMSELSLYGNQLNSWNLHYFPWEQGDAYRFAPTS